MLCFDDTVLTSSQVSCQADVAKILGSQAKRGDDYALEVVLPMLKEKDAVTQRAAIEALGKLCPPDCREIISTLVCCLREPVYGAAEVGAALLEIPATDDATLSSVNELFSHEDWMVRKGSLVVFSILASGPVRSEFLVGILDSVHDESLFVREAAIRALMRCAVRGDADVVDALRACLKDSAPLVRKAAVEALGVLTSAGDIATVTAVAPLLHDKAWPVCEAAAMLGKRQLPSASWSHKPYRSLHGHFKLHGEPLP